MEHARPCAVTMLAMPSVAVPEKRITAGLLKQHKRKVLCTHCRFHGAIDVVSTYDIRHDIGGELRLFWIVDRRWIVAMEVQIDFAIVGSRGRVDDLPHP